MDFNTYTSKGLTHLLHEELNNTNINSDLVKRINIELKRRIESNQFQMSVEEQIHWIIMDTNFEQIHDIEEFLMLNNGKPFKPTTINGLMLVVKEMLIRIANTVENDDGYSSYKIGNFLVEKTIYDGVMCLSFKHVVGGWDMDYDAVTSQNYCEPEDEYTGG